MYRGFDKKYIVNVELLMGEFYTYSAIQMAISMAHGSSFDSIIFAGCLETSAIQNAT